MHAIEQLPRASRPTHCRSRSAADDDLQRLPLLRGAVRGVSRHGDAPRLRRGDLNYLANLCHNAAPATRDASTRRRTSSPSTSRARWQKCATRATREYAWPRALARAVRAQRAGGRARRGAGRRGVLLGFVALARSGGAVRAPCAATSTGDAAQRDGRPVRRGLRSTPSLACVMSLTRYWRDIGADGPRTGAPVGQALARRLHLEISGRRRRRLHQRGRAAVAARGASTTTSPSTASCSASPRPRSPRSITTLFGWHAPYRVVRACRSCSARSAASGCWSVRRAARAAAGAIRSWATPRSAAWTRPSSPCCSSPASPGWLLLVLRDTAAWGCCWRVHLGVVLALFLTLPYGKFVHGLYRFLALVKYAGERGTAGSSNSIGTNKNAPDLPARFAVSDRRGPTGRDDACRHSRDRYRSPDRRSGSAARNRPRRRPSVPRPPDPARNRSRSPGHNRNRSRVRSHNKGRSRRPPRHRSGRQPRSLRCRRQCRRRRDDGDVCACAGAATSTKAVPTAAAVIASFEIMGAPSGLRGSVR